MSTSKSQETWTLTTNVNKDSIINSQQSTYSKDIQNASFTWMQPCEPGTHAKQSNHL